MLKHLKTNSRMKGKISHGASRKSRRAMQSFISAVEPLEVRCLMSTVVQNQTETYGPNFTNFTNQPLAPAIAQFDTHGGALILDSVEVQASSSVVSALSGSITNGSTRQIATYAASTINATTSVSGPGLTNVSASTATLLNYKATIPANSTMNLPPQQMTLPASADVVLTNPSDLSQFLGTGTLSYVTSATATSSTSLSGSSIVTNNTVFMTTGKASVTVIYNYHPTPVVITTQASETNGGTVGSAVLSDAATISGGYNVGGSISFTLTQPDGSTISLGNVAVNGDGTYASPTVVATEVGTYTFHATYSGDSLNNSAIDDGTNESVTTAKENPAIVTQASEQTNVIGIALLGDTATISGGYNVGGNIDFTLTKPDGSTIEVGTVAVSGDGNYASPQVLADEVGTYTFHASYSGDSLNNSAIDDGTNESVTTVQASPAIVTQASEQTNVVGSAVLGDAATISGGYNVGGSISFTLTQPDGSTISIGTVPVNGNGTYASPTVAATQVGTYTFHATYSGDSLNNSAIDDGTNESVTTVKASPSIVTQASEQTNVVGSAVLGDAATVSGGYNVGGSISFTLTQPDGSTISIGTVPVNGDGTYASPTVAATQVGTYIFHATYSGDSLNNSAIDDGTNESVTTVKASPAINTSQQPATATVGTLIADKATVTGGYNPTGTVTFTLYNNPNGTGTPLYVDSNESLVNGVATSVGYVATAAGTDYWVATYNGDSNNKPVMGGTADEPVIIKKASPSIVTTASENGNVAGSATSTDSAVISGGYNESGSIVFKLVDPTGATVSSQTVSINGNGTYSTSPVTLTTIGTYTWKASYAGDSLNNGAVDQGGSAEQVVANGTPNITVVKTADQANIFAGDTAGYTVTITNNGTATDTHVTLSDPLPAGNGGDIEWQIDTTGSANPADFDITGFDGSQTLVLSNTFLTTLGDSLAPGQSISVHLTSSTDSDDATGATGSINPALGILGQYAVLFDSNGHQLSIANDTVSGNIGVYGTGSVQFSGPGTIAGRVDFSGANTAQFHNTNSSNVGPTSVNYNVANVTTARNLEISLSSGLGGLTGTNLAIGSSDQTVNESAGTLATYNGVTYRVFNLTSYTMTAGHNLTIVGDGSGDPVLFNVAYNSNSNINGGVVLGGSGLNSDLVVWNFTSSGKNIQMAANKGTFVGVMLLPNDTFTGSSVNIDGRIFGGAGGNMQIVSGTNVYAPTMGTLSNTATVSATNVPSKQSTATINIFSTVPVPTPTPTPTPSSPVSAGDFATIGFWHNKNGQAVINSFNGSTTSTALGNWLATNWPNLFGVSNPYTGTSLAGLTNAQVATVYSNTFGGNGGAKNTYLQAFAVALGLYADSSNLGFDATASKYGFASVNGGGLILSYNIGSNGAAYGVSNNSSLTVAQILTITNNNFSASTGLFYSGDATNTNAFNNVLNGINTTGDVN